MMITILVLKFLILDPKSPIYSKMIQIGVVISVWRQINQTEVKRFTVLKKMSMRLLGLEPWIGSGIEAASCLMLNQELDSEFWNRDRGFINWCGRGSSLFVGCLKKKGCVLFPHPPSGLASVVIFYIHLNSMPAKLPPCQQLLLETVDLFCHLTSWHPLHVPVPVWTIWLISHLSTTAIRD